MCVITPPRPACPPLIPLGRRRVIPGCFCWQSCLPLPRGTRSPPLADAPTAATAAVVYTAVAATAAAVYVAVAATAAARAAPARAAPAAPPEFAFRPPIPVGGRAPGRPAHHPLHSHDLSPPDGGQRWRRLGAAAARAMVARGGGGGPTGPLVGECRGVEGAMVRLPAQAGGGAG